MANFLKLRCENARIELFLEHFLTGRNFSALLIFLSFAILLPFYSRCNLQKVHRHKQYHVQRSRSCSCSFFAGVYYVMLMASSNCNIELKTGKFLNLFIFLCGSWRKKVNESRAASEMIKNSTAILLYLFH